MNKRYKTSQTTKDSVACWGTGCWPSLFFHNCNAKDQFLSINFSQQSMGESARILCANPYKDLFLLFLAAATPVLVRVPNRGQLLLAWWTVIPELLITLISFDNPGSASAPGKCIWLYRLHSCSILILKGNNNLIVFLKEVSMIFVTMQRGKLFVFLMGTTGKREFWEKKSARGNRSMKALSSKRVLFLCCFVVPVGKTVNLTVQTAFSSISQNSFSFPCY